ncbi:camp-dependent protein kinase catalytic subunit [Entophlyctis luteolus]|nr:camp-dependent protein kinase catalytic subunit [Entophlyctis luteolus]
MATPTPPAEPKEKMSFIKKLTLSAKEGTLFKKSNTVSPNAASVSPSKPSSARDSKSAAQPVAAPSSNASPSKPHTATASHQPATKPDQEPNTNAAASTQLDPAASGPTPASVATRGVNPANAPPPKPKQKFSIPDFTIDRTLGTGSFGRVHLVRLKETGKYYAMKVLLKNEVVKMKQVEHTINEKNILSKLDYPFLVYMLGTIQDSQNLYFILEYVQGGEVFSFLRRSGRFQNSVAKFYAVEVILAFEYLHMRDIIYRDLKPETILPPKLFNQRDTVELWTGGHLEFLFTRCWPDTVSAVCYIFPDKSADIAPFYDDDHFKLYEKILACRPKFPSHFDPNAKDLVKRILTTDLSKRYGNLKAGVADIKCHKWFADVQWQKMEDCQVAAPYLPPCKGEGDTSNFDQYAEDHEPYGVTGPDPHKDKFVGF